MSTAQKPLLSVAPDEGVGQEAWQQPRKKPECDTGSPSTAKAEVIGTDGTSLWVLLSSLLCALAFGTGMSVYSVLRAKPCGNFVQPPSTAGAFSGVAPFDGPLQLDSVTLFPPLFKIVAGATSVVRYGTTGRVYTVTDKGGVVAFDGQSGRQVWAQESLSKVTLIALGLWETLFVDGADEAKYCGVSALSCQTGSVAWRALPWFCGGLRNVLSIGTDSDGNAVVVLSPQSATPAASSFSVYVLGIEDGAVLRSYLVQRFINDNSNHCGYSLWPETSLPALVAGSVVVRYGNCSVQCEEVRWNPCGMLKAVNTDLLSSIDITGGTVPEQSSTLSPIRWSRVLTQGSYSPSSQYQPIVRGDGVVIVASTAVPAETCEYFVPCGFSVNAFRADGSELWSVSNSSSPLHVTNISLAGVNSNVCVVVLSNGSMIGIDVDSTNGSVLWTNHANSTLRWQPVTSRSGRSVYFVSTSPAMGVVCLDAMSGEIIATRTLPAGVTVVDQPYISASASLVLPVLQSQMLHLLVLRDSDNAVSPSLVQ